MKFFHIVKWVSGGSWSTFALCLLLIWTHWQYIIRGERIDILIVHRPSLNKFKFSMELTQQKKGGGGKIP